MNRYKTRELAFCLVFELAFLESGDISEKIQETIELAAQNRDFEPDEYISKTVFGVFNNIEEIDSKIEKSAVGWKIDRVSCVTKALLRLAIFEIIYNEQVPTAVAINEAVELAKEYEGIEASAFINGILGNIARENQEA